MEKRSKFFIFEIFQVLSELCMAVGINTDVDVALVHAIRAQTKQTEPDEHYTLSCLLLVFIALSLPRLALTQNSQYSASLLGVFYFLFRIRNQKFISSRYNFRQC